MDYLWEFFEELDEAVYVSDMETNELVYMNAHLRKALGISSDEEYVGKRCHSLLQGSDIPCLFCTNCKLKPGEFVSWVHKNPIINKTFLVKDSMIQNEGRSYRVEIAIDLDEEGRDIESYYYARGETILNGCLQQLFTTLDPACVVERILAYIGQTFMCDRCYVFEIDDADMMSNSYEWCAEGIAQQKDMLQNDSITSIDWWMDMFQKNEVVVIENLEDIRAEHPASYALLKSRGVSALVAGPMREDNRVMGFVGVDNPSMHMVPLLAPLLNIIGYFLLSLTRRRDLLQRLNRLSFHDSLTGAYNRHAMSEHQEKQLQGTSMGVIYCDITGLKQTNDSIGHDAGDEMIRHCYGLICDALDTKWIYRTGGDEFVAVCLDSSEADFQQLVQTFRERVRHAKHHIAVGYAWSDQKPFNLESMISQADKIMYQDKRDYYAEKRMITGVDRRSREEPPKLVPEDGDSLFQQFMMINYHDIESLFRSMAQENTSSYFYFGDMQRDVFYISENMRSEFGFESNVVPGLLRQWAQYISTPKFRDMYWNELQDMIENKREVHDLRYQVRKANGENIWIRCYGILKWNDEKTAPLFFSGRITHQDDEFVVDPVTNLPRGSAAFKRLNELERTGKQVVIIGFCVNNITEINNTRGRTYADRLLRNIANSLTNELSDKMTFYRLEGMRGMALVDTECTESEAALVQQIRTVIEGCYSELGLSIHSVCSFGVMHYPYENFSPENFQEDVISLIRLAKNDIKQSYVEYSSVSVQRIQEMSKMALALSQDVTNGMQNFRIVIQPVVNAHSGEIRGGEVLLRWTFEGKNVSPAIFIPMLEKNDMIHLAGRWVFDQAVRNCIRLISYIPEFYLTFNVSLRQLTDMHFADVMRETIERYHLGGTHLIAEMTESCLDEQPDNLIRFVEMCKEIGIRIALDDFGSGYSSLRMLLRYPCDVIKLDRSLLEEIAESNEKLQFIRSIVYACHQFGRKVCVEGVETEEQRALIEETGCDLIQGFYFFHPMELPDLYKLLSESQNNAG